MTIIWIIMIIISICLLIIFWMALMSIIKTGASWRTYFDFKYRFELGAGPSSIDEEFKEFILEKKKKEDKSKIK